MRVFNACLYFLFIAQFGFGAEYFQQTVNYKIDVTLHPEKKIYSGNEVMTYFNQSPDTLDFIWIHCYPNAYKDNSTPFARQRAKNLQYDFRFSSPEERGFLDFDKILIEGQEITGQFKENAIDEMRLDIPGKLLPGDSVIIRFEFSGKFPKVFSRMGYFGKDNFAVTQWYPKAVVYDKSGWHPDSYLDLGEFYGEFGQYDVTITVPENYAIDATGMLQNNPAEEEFIHERCKLADSLLNLTTEKARQLFIKDYQKQQKERLDYTRTKTLRFLAGNVHDFAWFAGNDYLILQRFHNDSVLTNVLVSPDNLWAWRDAPRYVEQTIRFYNERVGRFQYSKASVVDGLLIAGGGMEYPMITVISVPASSWLNLLEVTIMHEVGHNWFYGMLGSNERRDAFLDEGLNSLLEYKYMVHYHGDDNVTTLGKKMQNIWRVEDIGEWHLIQLMYGMNVVKGLDQPINTDAAVISRNNYSGVYYQKGAAMLLALEWLIGGQTFWQAIRDYFAEWNGRHPTHEDFFEIVNRTANQDLSWFYNEWYDKTSFNDFILRDIETTRSPDGYESRTFIENNGSMQNMPAPVRMITVAGDTLHGRWQADPHQPVVFKHQSPVKEIRINPDRIIFETNYLNNSTWPEIKINLLGQFPRFDRYDFNILPYYWFENFKDKHRVGLGFWSGNPFYRSYFAHGSVYYGTASGRIGYDLNLSNRTRKLSGNYSDLGATVKDMDGLRRFSASAGSHFHDPSDSRVFSSIECGFNYVKLHDEEYNDPAVFNKSTYSTATLGLHHTFRRQLYSIRLFMEYEQAFRIFNSQTAFSKMSAEIRFARRFSRSAALKVRLYAAGLAGSATPAQEYIYSGGDVDPKHKRFAFARRGAMAPLHAWFFNDGMGMPGYANRENPFRSGRAAAALAMDCSVFSLPAPYLSAGTNSMDRSQFGKYVFAEYGVKYESGPVKLICPLYITDPAPGESHFDWRFHFNIDFDLGL
jgi:hypothetical protein